MAAVSLLAFCLGDVSIDVSGLLKSSFTICVVTISPYKSVHILYIYILVYTFIFGFPILGAYMLTVMYS